jgi:hypothetical protein
MEGGGCTFPALLHLSLSYAVSKVHLPASGFLEKASAIINVFLGTYAACSLNPIRHNRNFLYLKGINTEI